MSVTERTPLLDNRTPPVDFANNTYKMISRRNKETTIYRTLSGTFVYGVEEKGSKPASLSEIRDLFERQHKQLNEETNVKSISNVDSNESHIARNLENINEKINSRNTKLDSIFLKLFSCGTSNNKLENLYTHNLNYLKYRKFLETDFDQLNSKLEKELKFSIKLEIENSKDKSEPVTMNCYDRTEFSKLFPVLCFSNNISKLTSSAFKYILLRFIAEESGCDLRVAPKDYPINRNPDHFSIQFTKQRPSEYDPEKNVCLIASKIGRFGLPERIEFPFGKTVQIEFPYNASSYKLSLTFDKNEQ